jgi:hypothetical protein
LTHEERQTQKKQTSTISSGGLFVNGEKFLVAGAEVHNSSSSTILAIQRSFHRVRDLGANTVLAPVAWDLFEPREGQFDFTLTGCMLETAQSEGLRLVILWFGTWKNAGSTYVPGWVKLDTDRFPRAETADAGRIEHVSPFGEQIRNADASAFAALMSHLASVDTTGTVIMIQVENEVGLLGDSRDRSELAEHAYHQSVPEKVLEAIASDASLPVHQDWVAAGGLRAGTWAETLGIGENAEEAFMAWAYASHVEAVASAGLAHHRVPLFVNAWLDAELDHVDGVPSLELAGGQRPGRYPSGGPIGRVGPIWDAIAPSLSMRAPDSYFGSFAEICAAYASPQGRLFIPEMRRSPLGVSQMLLAVGEFHAIGVSPFGVDSLEADDPHYAHLADGYRLLSAAASALRERPDAESRGFELNVNTPVISFSCGGFELEADSRNPIGGEAEPGFGIVIHESENVFLVIGRGFRITFQDPSGSKVGILAAAELEPGEEMAVIRQLNGDETGFGWFPSLGSRSTTSFPIPILTQMSGVVRFSLYRY